MRRVSWSSSGRSEQNQAQGPSNAHPLPADLQSLKVELKAEFERILEDFAVEFKGTIQRTVRDALQGEQCRKSTESITSDPTGRKHDSGFHVPATISEDECDWIRPLKTYVAGRVPAKALELVPDGSSESNGSDIEVVTATTPLSTYSSLRYALSRGARDETEQPHADISTGHCKALANFMGTLQYELFLVAMILLSALMLGVETQMSDYYSSKPLLVCEFVLCVVFTLDIVARLSVQRSNFFTHSDRAWNVFDLVIVGGQIFEQALVFVRLVFHTSTHSGSLRFVNFLRVIRLFRVVRFFDELRSILVSVLKSLQSLGWSMVMLVLVLYVFSIFFRQAVQDSYAADIPEELSYWYGSVFRTMLTLFESILGGVSWDEAIVPLMSHLSPLWAAAFLLYIIISLFVIQNLVAASFVVNLTRTVQDERDLAMASQIKNIFFEDDGHAIELEEFSHKLKAPEMQEYFKAIDLDPSEDRTLFALLDTGNKHCLTPDEVIDGCLRLRGPAKALDLYRFMKLVEVRLAGIQNISSTPGC